MCKRVLILLIYYYYYYYILAKSDYFDIKLPSEACEGIVFL